MNNKPFVHVFKTPTGFCLYDVNTNRIIRIDSELYNYFNAWLNTEEDCAPAASDIISEKLLILRNNGYLMEKRSIRMKHNMSDLLSFQLAKNIKQMSLQVTQQCNFRCAYCLYASKEFDVQRHHTSKRMSLETAIAAIDFFAAHSSAQQEICVGFYGGEPLLEFELIKRAIEYSEEVFEGKDLSFTMTSMAIYKNIPFVSTPYALIYGIWS